MKGDRDGFGCCIHIQMNTLPLFTIIKKGYHDHIANRSIKRILD